MDRLKKLTSLLLALVMVFAMTAMAFADTAAENSNVTKITVKEGDTRSYSVYQIFTGDLYQGILSNVKWGKNGTGVLGEAVPQATLDALTNVNTQTATNVEKLDVIKTYVNLESDAIGTVSAASPLEVVTGYYLIMDNGTVADGESYSLYVVEIVGPTEIAPKVGKVESNKKVDDKNDSNDTEDAENWQDSADYDIGDAVPFKLTGTVPADYDNYKHYYYAFHDTESDGLTFDASSVKVFVDNVEITTGFTVVTDCADKCTFAVVFADLKAITAVKAGSVITVEYTSVLNENAVIGALGNPNEMYLEYSNNPNAKWESSDKPGDNDNPETGKTPEDKVIVFTYKVIVDKVHQTGTDENGEPIYDALTGAGFTLYKWELTEAVEGAEPKYDWVAVGDEIIIAELKEGKATFEWKGLDDGNYKLEETTTPAGYNTIAPIEFTITAEHDITSDNPTLTALTGGDKFTGEVSTGALSTQVVNQTGTELPETGGMGTTMLYVVGGLLVVGAVVVMISKKKAEEK